MNQPRLIVNADDFGISKAINDGIVDAHEHGILTSTSIMPNGRAFRHAVEALRKTPRLGTGIHLTLVGEAPVSQPGEIASIVCDDGMLPGDAKAFVKRYLTGKIELRQIEHEFCNQIALVLDAGVTVTHLDSHQHIHVLPGIDRIVVRLARRFNIPAVRIPRESLAGYMFKDKRSASRLLELAALRSFCLVSRFAELKTPDHFRGFYFGGNMNACNLLTTLRSLPDTGTCEIMCHPGHSDPDSPYLDWQYRWDSELSALKDPDVRGYVEREGIKLVSFADLVMQA